MVLLVLRFIVVTLIILVFIVVFLFSRRWYFFIVNSGRLSLIFSIVIVTLVEVESGGELWFRVFILKK